MDFYYEVNYPNFVANHEEDVFNPMNKMDPL